jgi:hypothetical protein
MDAREARQAIEGLRERLGRGEDVEPDVGALAEKLRKENPPGTGALPANLAEKAALLREALMVGEIDLGGLADADIVREAEAIGRCTLGPLRTGAGHGSGDDLERIIGTDLFQAVEGLAKRIARETQSAEAERDESRKKLDRLKAVGQLMKQYLEVLKKCLGEAPAPQDPGGAGKDGGRP